MQDDRAIFRAVEESVLSWEYLARDEADVQALRRLVGDYSARASWRKLADLKLRHEWASFREIASHIGRSAVCANLPPSSLRTKNEIECAGDEAARVASRLVELIRGNATLEFAGLELLPDDEKAAFDRLQRGFIAQAVSGGGRVFSEEVEAELDELQARDYPEFRHMSSMDASRLLFQNNELWCTGFIGRLLRFAELAKQSAIMASPVVPKPGGAFASQQYFSVDVCSMLECFYGQPYTGIVAGFVSAVFNDQEVNDETVKSWWKRRGVSKVKQVKSHPTR